MVAAAQRSIVNSDQNLYNNLRHPLDLNSSLSAREKKEREDKVLTTADRVIRT